MSLDVLKKEIKQNIIRKVYLFYGPEEYLKKYYMSYIKDNLVPDDLKALNEITVEGKVEISQIEEMCHTMPFMSERRVIIIKNSGYFKPKGKAVSENSDKGISKDFANVIMSIPDSTCLIFFEEEIDKRLKTVDAVKKAGIVVEFPIQKAPDLAKWVINIAKSRGKQIDMVCASKIVENCGPLMNDIYNEIEKLILYTADRPKITDADIDNICTKTIKSRIFDLTDAMLEKDAEKAFKILDDLIGMKEPVPKILYMMARHFRQILQMKLLADEGLTKQECISEMEINPYVAGKLIKHFAAFSKETLKLVINECLEYDIAVKTGRINDRTAAELLIARFCK